MIIVWGMFKVGSTTIYNTLKTNFPHNNIIKSHTNINFLTDTDDISTIIVPIRKNKIKQYISAYFMDIDVPDYEYSPFNRILNTFINLPKHQKQKIINITDIKLLIDDFNTIEWDNYEWLSTKKSMDLIYSEFTFGEILDINDISDLKIIKGNRNKDNKKVTFIFIITEEINKKNMLNICKNSNLDINENTFKMVNSNIGTKKWYAKKYKEFLKNYL